MDPRIPCAKDCPNRHYLYCKTCPDWLAYKAEKDAEYEDHAKEILFKFYEDEQHTQRIKRSMRFKDGTLK